MTTPPRKFPGNLPILAVRREWDCPNCETQDVTERADAHTQMHMCPGLGGLALPLVEKARRPGGKRSVRVSPVLRQDYVGKEKGLVYNDEGQPIMAAVTEYGDGSNDVAVFAPVVRVEMRQ